MVTVYSFIFLGVAIPWRAMVTNFQADDSGNEARPEHKRNMLLLIQEGAFLHPLIYPLVNVYITVERSIIFHGKTYYFYGHVL